MFTERELKLLIGIVGSECDEAHDAFGDELRPPEDYGSPDELDVLLRKVKALEPESSEG